jgi:exopolysaccharide production protein ExoY
MNHVHDLAPKIAPPIYAEIIGRLELTLRVVSQMRTMFSAAEKITFRSDQSKAEPNYVAAVWRVDPRRQNLGFAHSWVSRNIKFQKDLDMRMENPKEETHLLGSLSSQMLLPAKMLRSHQDQHVPTGGQTKRALDLTVALSALVLLLPLIVLIALLVRFSDNGPVLYRHKRIGFRGREFNCLKFRTMVLNGDEVLQKHLELHPHARQEWIDTRKLTDDPRITSVGAILRKLSLDELPQILNILQGDMSVVGPRPIVQDELSMYGIYSSYYLQSRPGLTGMWQISGRSDTSYSQRVTLDTQYVSTWSMMNDIWIIICTVPAVILAKGSR